MFVQPFTLHTYAAVAAKHLFTVSLPQTDLLVHSLATLILKVVQSLVFISPMAHYETRGQVTNQ